MARKITVDLPGLKQPAYRPALVVAYGKRLFPETVTTAWYAAKCPPDFKPMRHGVSFGDTLRWKVARLLRGCR